MNFALSQRRPDRHPVGLIIVVGLHVLVAAALLSARLKSPPVEPPPINLEPLKPVLKVQPKPTILPQAAQIRLQLQAPLPVIDVDRPEPTLQVAPLTHPAARPAVLNAGALGCRPVYPPAAQRAGATGVSRIRFTVDALGHVGAAQILQSAGPTREHRLMDKAAADALAQCPVTAGTDEAGRAVGGTADVDYVWKLN
jgi:protein TonB